MSRKDKMSPERRKAEAEIIRLAPVGWPLRALLDRLQATYGPTITLYWLRKRMQLLRDSDVIPRRTLRKTQPKLGAIQTAIHDFDTWDTIHYWSKRNYQSPSNLVHQILYRAVRHSKYLNLFTRENKDEPAFEAFTADDEEVSSSEPVQETLPFGKL